MTEPVPRPFVLLTQNDCPNCDRLKMMLRGPLKGQFDDRIVTVHRQNDEAEFAALTAAHHIQTTPALLHLAVGPGAAQHGRAGRGSALSGELSCVRARQRPAALGQPREHLMKLRRLFNPDLAAQAQQHGGKRFQVLALGLQPCAAVFLGQARCPSSTPARAAREEEVPATR